MSEDQRAAQAALNDEKAVQAFLKMLTGDKKKSQATQIVDMVLNDPGIELFHTRNGDAYAAIRVDEHIEILETRIKAFREYVARLFQAAQDAAPGGQAIRDAVATLNGIARYDRSEEMVYTRVAEYDGDIWLDLADAEWRAVRISPLGWEVVDNPPVRFRRPRDMGELPAPEPGDVDELHPFVNVESADFILALGMVGGRISSAWSLHNPLRTR